MILLDIEGTTTPIAFVTRTLFPYARAHMRSYLEQHGASAQDLALIDRVRQEYATDDEAHRFLPAWSGSGADARPSVEAYAAWLMDRDRKSPALKELQGRIWEAGYLAGELVGDVFPDVPGAFARWQAAGIAIGIFSSGSVLAQRLLFSHSSAGDLSPFLQWYFDTLVGKKQAATSYARIAETVGESPAQILFVSDLVSELDAARAAGMQTRLSNRQGNAPQPAHDHRVVRSFDDIGDRPEMLNAEC